MRNDSMLFLWVGSAVLASAALTSSAAKADVAVEDDRNTPTAVVVAEASAPDSARMPQTAVTTDTFPAYQRGVRRAANESNEALRRYIWRTRMIHNFYFADFAPKE